MQFNSSEPNKPESKFCAKCRIVLTYDAYNETLEKQQKKESEIQVLKQNYVCVAMREEMEKIPADTFKDRRCNFKRLLDG